MTLALELLFLAAAALVAYVGVGFPLLLALRGLRPQRPPRRDGPLPSTSLVIVAHNERHVIDAKLDDVAALDFPAERLEIVFASDGSDDGTVARVVERATPAGVGAGPDAAEPPWRVLDLPRLGKNAALNAAVEAASGEVLVFSDADSRLAPDSVRRLVEPFADPEVGAVAGDFHYGGHYGGPPREGVGERAGWNLDRWWKRLESRAGDVTSATGQLYAIRAELFEPVPDGVTDDFFVSTGAVAAGRRLWFEPRARAWGAVASSSELELRRKLRVAARGFASLWGRRVLLDPRRTGFYALQLFTHKVLRRLLGVPLAVAFVTSLALAPQHPFYAAAAGLQGLFHAAALAGWWLRDTAWGRFPGLALPLHFDGSLLASLRAVLLLARGQDQRLAWTPERAPAPIAPAEDG